MFKKVITLFIIIISFQAKAQSDTKKSLNISFGFANTYPYDDVEVHGSGISVQTEYVISPKKWVDFRPYIGLIFTKTSSENNESNLKSSCNALVLGGKARIIAPIPYVAPYIESGFGASIGNFDTFTPYNDIDKNGIITHVPLSLGLEIGKNRKFDIGFSYYYHPNAEQFTGSYGFGIKFPL